jgi:hypothetical protein
VKPSGWFVARVRGFRVVDLMAMPVLLTLALSVYAFKTSAGRERADITDVEAQIRVERRDVRLLTAEVSGLEGPDRLERLARTYAEQAPVSAKQEVTPDTLPTIATPGAAP